MQFIGEKLRKLRDKNRWSLMDVEEFTGISQSALSDIENNKKQPRAATVEKLCKAFKIDQIFFYMPDSRLPEDLLPDLDADTKEFLMNGENIPYVILSKKAKESGLPPDVLETLINLYTKKDS